MELIENLRDTFAKGLRRAFGVAMICLCAVAATACRDDDMPKVDPTHINVALLQSGWTFVGVNSTVKCPMKNIVKNATDSYMQRNTVGVRYFYFYGDTCYSVKHIDDPSERSCRKSRYHVEGNRLCFDDKADLFADSYVPYVYVKDQTINEMTIYLAKDGVCDLLRADSETAPYVGKVEDVVCELYLDRFSHPFFNEIMSHAQGKK